MYEVIYTEYAFNTLSKFDLRVAAYIYAWIEKKLMGCYEPRCQGEELNGGAWRYKIGDYRLLADISTNPSIITIMAISHRQEDIRIYGLKGRTGND